MIITAEEIAEMRQVLEDMEETRRSPTAFMVLTVDEKEIYTTYEITDSREPVWRETFEMEICDVSMVVVRVFDVKSMARYGWGREQDSVIPTDSPEGEKEEEEEEVDGSGSGLVGYTSLMPSSMLWDMEMEKSNDGAQSTALITGTSAPKETTGLARSFPLQRNGKLVKGMTVELRISTDLDGPIPLPVIPAHHVGLKKVQEKRKVAFIKYKGKKIGHRHERLTETYNLADPEVAN